MKPKDSLDKTKLTKLITKRLDRSIDYATVYKALGIFFSQLQKEFIENNCITIRNFGTFNPTETQPKLVRNVNTQELQVICKMRTVKFYAAAAMQVLLENKRKRFMQESSKKRASQKKDRFKG
jgi:nucleoid DNA-binding protein